MIEIADVKTGTIPYAGGAGIQAIGVYVGENKALEIEEKDYEQTAEEMLNEIRAKVGEEMFERAMKANMQICFIGNGMELKHNAPLVDLFFTKMSKTSLEIQKTDKTAAHKMRPPFVVWIGKPLTYTGERQFYENFNYVIAQCPLEWEGATVTKETIGKVYAATSLMEIANHSFSMFVFKIKRPSDLDGIDIYLKNTIPVAGDRIIIIPEESGETDLITACYEYATANKMRLGVDYSQVFGSHSLTF